jgi:hypothetical protein
MHPTGVCFTQYLQAKQLFLFISFKIIPVNICGCSLILYRSVYPELLIAYYFILFILRMLITLTLG